MGGSGGIIAIQGILDNVASKQRFAGLQAAMGEASGIELLDQQTANWSRSEALTVTQTLLAKHRGKVKGLWAANDEMALGALEALKAAGLAGEIPIVGFDAVPQALDEILSGENKYVATVSTDPFWQGGAALSLAFQVATGKVDIKSLGNEKRAFYGKQSVVTKENAGDFTATPALSALQADFDDPWAAARAPSPTEAGRPGATARPPPLPRADRRRETSCGGDHQPGHERASLPGLRAGRRLTRDAGPLVALVALVVVFAVASPTFLTPGNLSTLLTQISSCWSWASG